MSKRLHQDHANAQTLAHGIAELPWVRPHLAYTFVRAEAWPVTACISDASKLIQYADINWHCFALQCCSVSSCSVARLTDQMYEVHRRMLQAIINVKGVQSNIVCFTLRPPMTVPVRPAN